MMKIYVTYKKKTEKNHLHNVSKVSVMTCVIDFFFL
jgi:hypothetical protein